MKQILSKLFSYVGYEISKAPNQNDVDMYLKLFGKDSVKNRCFYNICVGGHWGFGGGFHHPCWTNVDLLKKNSREFNPEKDIAHDLLSLDPLPIQSQSAELVYSQYAIEHIPNNSVLRMFKEVNRILKNKGIFRIVTPNIELDYIAYMNKDISFYEWIDYFSQPHIYKQHGYKSPLNQSSFEQIFLSHFATNASTLHREGEHKRVSDEELIHVFNTMSLEDALDHCTSRCSVEVQKRFRQNHMNWWSHSKLNKMLNEAGFKSVYHLIPGQSASPVMRNNAYFERNWNCVAMVIEAVKY